MPKIPRVALQFDELLPLREAMRDVQEGVAAYYAASARHSELGRSVRIFLDAAQRVNDLLTSAITDARTYRSLFDPPAAAGTEVINAVKYARNVNQHLLHIVRPRVDTLIGGALGMRVYAYWQAVPPEVHAKLHARTQALASAYNRELLGQEVTGTMLTVLRFYAQAVPEIVHRDHRGEWTGFPLMS